MTHEELVVATWQALQPWINQFRCGLKRPNRDRPFYLLSKETIQCWELYQRQRFALYSDGRVFQTKNYFGNVFDARLLRKMLESGVPYYYEGGLQGQGMSGLDFDAHHPWQTDVDEARRLVMGVLGADHFFSVGSERGIHDHFKYSFPKLAVAQETLRELQQALHFFLKSHGIRCDIEVKGVPQTSLLKFPCYKDWTEARLIEFNVLPVLTTNWLQERIALLRAQTDTAKAIAFSNHCELLKNPERAVKLATGTTILKVEGSLNSGLPLTEEQVERIPEYLDQGYQRACYLYAMHKNPNTKKQVTRMDFQIGLLVTSLCALHPNENHANPNLRIESLWRALYDAGNVARSFDNSRWKVIRDTMIDCGFLEEIDSTYWFYTDGRPGKAMQWELYDRYNVIIAVDDGNVTTSSTAGGASMREVYSAQDLPVYVYRRWRPRWDSFRGLEERVSEIIGSYEPIAA